MDEAHFELNPYLNTTKDWVIKDVAGDAGDAGMAGEMETAGMLNHNFHRMYSYDFFRHCGCVPVNANERP